MDYLLFAIIFVSSLILGILKYGCVSNSKEFKSSWQLIFFEIWNCFFNFFITGLLAYYFILIRWPLLKLGEVFGFSDFGLLAVFMLGVFGHLAVLAKNLTEGMNAILKRVLER